MPKQPKLYIMPTKLRYKFIVSFCLMSLIPNLVGVYIGSQFIQYPFDDPFELMSISLMVVLSLFLSLLGFQIIGRLMNPIINVSVAAKHMAQGKLEEPIEAKGTEELEDLSNSLKIMSTNARELLEKVEKLSLKDKLTGLYNNTYIRERLNEEIQRAIHNQRPCAFAYFNIDRYGAHVLKYGEAASEDILKSAANILSKHLTQFDRAARIKKDEFAVIFADKNKKKAIDVVERISKDIAVFSFTTKGFDEKTLFTVSVGISENPIDGVTGDELYYKAQGRLKVAKAKGANLIEAFA